MAFEMLNEEEDGEEKGEEKGEVLVREFRLTLLPPACHLALSEAGLTIGRPPES